MLAPKNEFYMFAICRWICNVLTARTKPRLYRQTRLQLSQELILWCSAQTLMGLWLGIRLDCSV